MAQKLLGSIQNKLNKNKYTLWGTIFIVIAVVVCVIYTYVG
jgi:t-SNARE complex subunit (syntaxin)